MAIQKAGGRSTASAPASGEGGSGGNSRHAALMALSARQASEAASSSAKKSKRRGQLNKSQTRAKLERAVGNADRLQMKAVKRAKRDEKRKRGKEVIQS